MRSIGRSFTSNIVRIFSINVVAVWNFIDWCHRLFWRDVSHRTWLHGALCVTTAGLMKSEQSSKQKKKTLSPAKSNFQSFGENNLADNWPKTQLNSFLMIKYSAFHLSEQFKNLGNHSCSFPFQSLIASNSLRNWTTKKPALPITLI